MPDALISDTIFPMSPLSPQINKLAQRLVTTLADRGWTLTTAESCTGGLIAASITDIPGASAVFHRGVITYADREKVRLLDVSQALLDTKGAVSAEVADAMARGALKQGQSDMALAVTGIAGPGGGTPDKPVGLVHVCSLTRSGKEQHQRHLFDGDRNHIRLATVHTALSMGLSLLTDHGP